MKTDAKIMTGLAAALAMELTAINRYLLHAHLLEGWGFAKLSAKMREEMAEETGHADRLMQRILFLGGVPNTGKLNKIDAAKSVRHLFERDLKDEKEAVRYYSEAASQCEAERDHGSRQLFVSLIADEEGHAARLEQQLALMDHIGEQNYLQLQL
jgi:bacterioferritin